jgi:hypothetical protein
MEMQLVVARVAAAAAITSEASTQTSLEASRQSAEDRTIAADTAAATAATERDSLVSRLGRLGNMPPSSGRLSFVLHNLSHD